MFSTNRAHALDLCLVSMNRYTSNKTWRRFTTLTLHQVKDFGSMSTNTLSRMLPMPHLELLDKRRTSVTLYQEVQTSRSTPNQMMHLKDEDGEKSCPEDLKHWILVGGGQDRRLKSPFLIKKDDLGVPSIECTINRYFF